MALYQHSDLEIEGSTRGSRLPAHWQTRKLLAVARRYGLPVVTATFAILATALPSAASGDTVANARNATAIFNNAAAAPAAGYDLLTDAAGTACIEQPGTGAMGVHFVKGALVQSGTLDATRPQALVYEVQAGGQLRLAALEYVVFQSTWDAAHPAPPTLFGQKFVRCAGESSAAADAETTAALADSGMAAMPMGEADALLEP